jgi:hypothetical protein
MKIHMLALFGALMFLLASCAKEKESTDDQLVASIRQASEKIAVNPQDLPSAAQQSLESKNFDSYVEEVWHVPTLGFEVVMGDEELIHFNEAGRRLEHRGRRFMLDENGPCRDRGRLVPADKLTQKVLGYIADNYSGHSVRIGKMRFDKLVVLLQPRLVLLFDKDGNFIEELPGFIHCPALCFPLATDKLPSAILEHIEANYPDAGIKRACVRRMNFITVGILTPVGPRVLVYDKNHQFLFSRP